MNESLQKGCDLAINRLAKWRAVFAGWQLGTRPKGDPESDAVRDHRELSLIVRVELTALTRLLIDKGVIDIDEFFQAVINECELQEQDLRRRFPGFEATDVGMSMDVQIVNEWMQERGWKP